MERKDQSDKPLGNKVGFTQIDIDQVKASIRRMQIYSCLQLKCSATSLQRACFIADSGHYLKERMQSRS